MYNLDLLTFGAGPHAGIVLTFPSLAADKQLFRPTGAGAFSSANVVPGIGFSPDRILQARRFSYGGTRRYRLDVNF